MELEIKDKINNVDCHTVSDEIEQEDLYGAGSEATITKPFDPNSIDVDMATVNLGLLIDQLVNDEIDLQPDFQRASDIWTTTGKSRLIESILLGLPLPSFYFSEDSYSQKLSVIDGLQRLCAIKDFVIDKKLKLHNLQFLHVFEGKGFDDLERPEIRRIKALKISVNTLRKATPNDVKYIIFQRVNTAGVPLTSQEMRHALNQGPAACFIKQMAELNSFVQATSHSVSSKRMEDRDFANRFVAFYLGYDEYNGELDNFLNVKMGDLNRMTEIQRNDILVAFDKSMQCCHAIFGQDTFRKRLVSDAPRSRISKAVFDTVSVNIAWLSDEQRSRLASSASLVRERMMTLFHDDKFMKAISTGTAQKYNVQTRFSEFKKMIDIILEQ